MKYMNMIKKYGRLNLQIFAEGGDGSEGDGNGDDSGDDGNEGDDEDGEDDDPDEKLFSQADVDKAIEKRIAREKRKWKREQAKEKGPDSKGKAGDNNDDGKNKSGEQDPEVDKLKAKASKADELELKWACLEHDVDKSCVDDVLALAKVHMAKDEDMDIEDAIDKVLKKYPQFKTGASNSDDDEDTDGKKAWGQRQKGKGSKISGVEAAFLKKNPGLKID